MFANQTRGFASIAAVSLVMSGWLVSAGFLAQAWRASDHFSCACDTQRPEMKLERASK